MRRRVERVSSRQGRLVRSCAAVATLGAALSCQAPTQIVVHVTTDVPCEIVALHGVTVRVALSTQALLSRAPAAATAQCDGGEVGTLVIVPGDDREASVSFEVLAGVDREARACADSGTVDGCIAVRRRLPFVEHRSIDLPVRLLRICAGVDCPEGTTCDSGRCVPVDCEGPACPAAAVDGGPRAPLSCAGGRADCDGLAETGCETDLRTDGAHCGACGRSCGGAACVDGACAPSVVVPNIDMPTGLVVAGQSLYVTSQTAGGAVVRCPLSGCTTPTVLRSGVNQPGPIAVDATHVYWAAAVSLQRCLLPGCTGVETIDATAVNALALDAQTIFYSDVYNYYWARRPKAGGNPQYLAIANAEPLPQMVVDGPDVYYAEGYPAYTPMTVRRCPATGCVPVGSVGAEIASAPKGRIIDGLAVDATHFYWSEHGGTEGGRLMRRAKDLVAPAEVVTAGLDVPQALAVDAAHVYVVERGGGRVLRVDKAARAVVELARGQTAPHGLALSTDRVYWTNRVPAGAVLSVPK